MAPVLVNPVPDQIINEGAAFRPFSLKDFITSASGSLSFVAELSDGKSLPTGLICTSDGILTGIPARGTEGHYDIVVTVQDNSDTSLKAEFKLTIKQRPEVEDPFLLNKLKAQVWVALENNSPLPDMTELLNRPITLAEVYYLLERWATLTVWDVYNLDSPAEKTLLPLEGVSQHFNVYDRGSSIIAAPKDLFSHARTLEDALGTARAVAREVYKRNWTIELGGFNKMIRAAWIEIQQLNNQHGRRLEVLHYNPMPYDLQIYVARANAPKSGI